MNSRMHKLTIRIFTDELKTEIVRRMQSGEPAETLAHHLCVLPKLLEGWRKEYESKSPKTGRQTEEGQEAAATGSLRLETLGRVVGRQALEIDFLKRTISRLKTLPTSYGENWRMRVVTAIQEEEELAKPLIRSCGRAEIGWPTD